MRVLGAGPKSGRRKFSQELNLVPFIDFFSTLIIFLMVSVVFDRLAAIQVNMGAEDTSNKVQVKKEVVKKIEASLKATINKNELTLFDAGKNTVIKKEPTVDDKGQTVDKFPEAPIKEFMANARQRYPDKKDIVIFSSDDSPYEDLIVVLDASLGEKFTELVVTGSE